MHATASKVPVCVRLGVNVRVWVRAKGKFPLFVRLCDSVRFRTKLIRRLKLSIKKGRDSFRSRYRFSCKLWCGFGLS